MLAGAVGRPAIRLDVGSRTGGHAAITAPGATRHGSRPDRAGIAGRRIRAAAKHPRLMPYRRLMIAVLAVNVALGLVQLRRGGWSLGDGRALEASADLTLVNLAVAVLIRQQALLNVLYGLAGRGSPQWPLWVRWSISKVHHVGGIHAGAAIAGTVWLGAFTGAAIVTRFRHPGIVTLPTLVIGITLALLLIVVTVCASAPVRMRAHNVFEQSHRWGGWTSLLLYWMLTIHLAAHRGGAVVVALASDWHVWVLGVLTLCIAGPWLRLRRVPITCTGRPPTSPSSTSITA